MTARRHEHGAAPLVIGLIGSIALHLFLLIPLLMAAMKPAEGARLVSALAPEPPHDDRVMIGVEESEASTLDWVGYEEYQQHLAEFSETNQALFENAAAATRGAEPAEPSMVEAPLEPADPTETAEPELDPDPAPEPESAPGPQPEPVEAQPTAVEPVEATESAPPPLDPAPALRAASEWLLQVLAPWPRRSDSRNPARQSENSSTRDGQEHAPESPAVPPGQPVETTEQRVAEPSPRESDPTSTVRITKDQWVLGKPLAAKGGQLFPQKPTFQLLTRMTAVVTNPVALIEFDHRGIVVHAELIRPSGHNQVDKNIIDSLYGWRASGGQFGTVPEGETIEIEMQFHLIR